MSNPWPAFTAAILFLAAPSAAQDGVTDAAPRRCAPCTVRVMSFNIEWGGTHVRFASVVEAIVASGADIAGIQEPQGNLARLARALGWHLSRRNHVISKYPLVDPPGGGGRFLFVEVTPGRVVAIANVHLPSDPYGPYWLRAGRTSEEVMMLEREVRLSAITPLLDTLEPIYRRGVPVFLAGDFNAPSHEDWTEAAAGHFLHRDAAFDWPVSRAVIAAGFRDSYRAVHPDPVAQPGFTWWAARPLIENYNPSDPGDRNRIDFVWFAGPATAKDSRLVGEANGRGVSVSISPWPSDHRAVLSEFRVEPAPMPVLVTTDRRVYRQGEEIGVTWHAPEAHASILLLRDGADGSPVERRVPVQPASGKTSIPTADLPPGAWRVTLLGADGRTISRNEFWILEPDAEPEIAVGAETLVTGDSVPISWQNAPGNRFDWIAIFDAAAAETSRRYVAYVYVDAQSTGSLELSAHTAREGWPLPPGRYVARLLEDDGFAVLAESAPFVVELPAGSNGVTGGREGRTEQAKGPAEQAGGAVHR